MAIVDYLVARAGCPPRSGVAYDYDIAGDGLFVVADNALLAVRVPIAPCLVRGLPSLGPMLQLHHGRLAHRLWEDVVDVAYLFAASGQEVLLAVTWDGSGYELVTPVQVVDPLQVHYRPLSNVILEIHSHHHYSACFSEVDDADEQRLCLYGVVGHLDCNQPEVALRVGAYGYFMPVPWEAVFAGDRGTFRDIQFDPADDRSDADDLRD